MSKMSLIFLLSFINVFAQSSSYQSAGAVANLLVPLSIETGIGNLNFGEILITGSNSEESIRPRDGKEFIVRGEANRSVTVNFNEIELTNLVWLSGHNGNKGSLTFEPNVISENSKRIRSGDSVNLLPNGLIGQLKFHVGGVIKIQPDQPIGEYEGIFIISVSY